MRANCLLARRPQRIWFSRNCSPALGTRITGIAFLVSVSAASVTLSAPQICTVPDCVRSFSPDPAASVQNHFCAIGLAFDGTDLYVNRCSDPNVYAISAEDGSFKEARSLLEPEPGPDPVIPRIPEWPAAMAYDSTPTHRGLWVATQMGVGGTAIGDCGTGLPIYFWAFNGPGSTDDTVTRVFTIPVDLVNPSNGQKFFDFCLLDGLAYNENDPTNDADDEIWCSATVNQNVAVFRPDGTFVRGFDATTVDGKLSSGSGLAIGNDKLYLATDCVLDPACGKVFIANRPVDILNGQLTVTGQFTSERQTDADMACDGLTFSLDGKTVMWVRTNPRGIIANDIITAYEIEPGGCGVGPQLGACCDPNNPPCRDVLQSACQGTWTAGVSCASLNPPCFETHRIILLDRTGSMEHAILADGRTRCRAAWETANSEIMSFFATHPIGSSVAVWTFAGSTAAPLTAGFVDEVSAIAALAPLGNTPCASATPLAEAVCDSVDALVATFSTAPMETLEVSISSDGLENNSSGPCLGPDSLGGMMCGGFDPGSWQQLVCDHAVGNAVMLVKLWGDTGSPLSQSSQGMDTETGQLLSSAGVSDAVFFQALADATGGTFTFIEDNPPQPSGAPAFGFTGACCLQNGTCQDAITQAECSVLGGTHQGDASTCALATCTATIPAASGWGLTVMTLLVLTLGTIILRGWNRARVNLERMLQ